MTDVLVELVRGVVCWPGADRGESGVRESRCPLPIIIQPTAKLFTARSLTAASDAYWAALFWHCQLLIWWMVSVLYIINIDLHRIYLFFKDPKLSRIYFVVEVKISQDYSLLLGHICLFKSGHFLEKVRKEGGHFQSKKFHCRFFVYLRYILMIYMIQFMNPIPVQWYPICVLDGPASVNASNSAPFPNSLYSFKII